MESSGRFCNIPFLISFICVPLSDDPRDTVELARRLAACGISALAVHGRTPQQRSRDPADWEPIGRVSGVYEDRREDMVAVLGVR